VVGRGVQAGVEGPSGEHASACLFSVGGSFQECTVPTMCVCASVEMCVGVSVVIKGGPVQGLTLGLGWTSLAPTSSAEAAGPLLNCS
jgi:hypothetical protein